MPAPTDSVGGGIFGLSVRRVRLFVRADLVTTLVVIHIDAGHSPSFSFSLPLTIPSDSSD